MAALQANRYDSSGAFGGASAGEAVTESQSSKPYWHVNVPKPEQSSECPEFLQSISEKDRDIIATPDSERQLLTWSDVRNVVGMLPSWSSTRISLL